jgi:4-deoxy-L-threo-5-hexosulose-uronate ketol-isomerase
MRYTPHPGQVKRMTTEELRSAFLIEDIFEPDQLVLHALDLDRVVLGGAMPVNAPIRLEPPPALAAEFFTERREVGVLNIGGAGRVRAADQCHELNRKDGLYIGRGVRDVQLESADSRTPARFYIISYPAHAEHATTRVTHAEAAPTDLGAQESANRRRLAKYFHPDGVKTAQLVMGVTELQSGSVWNTMPPHTHQRRTEVYLYFDIPEDAVVFHFLGEPSETRSIVVRDGQVALSPSWSIHAGCGTTNYSFCWAMGGENQAFADMQAVNLKQIR